MPHHVHSVSQVIDSLGKSAIHMARVYGERKKNFVGQQSLSRRSGGGDQLSPTSPDVAGADMDMPSWADWWFADIVLKSPELY